jgi:hypothetical protein
VVPVESSCPEVELGMDWVDSLGVVSTDCPAQSVQGSRNSKNAFDLIRSNSSDLNGGYTAKKQSIPGDRFLPRMVRNGSLQIAVILSHSLVQ